MRYWDNDKDRQFDEALDEMIRAQQPPFTEEDVDTMYQRHIMKTNISNPMKLYGAI